MGERKVEPGDEAICSLARYVRAQSAGLLRVLWWPFALPLGSAQPWKSVQLLTKSSQDFAGGWIVFLNKSKNDQEHVFIDILTQDPLICCVRICVYG